MTWLAKAYIPRLPPPDPTAIVRSLDHYQKDISNATQAVVLEHKLIDLIDKGLHNTPQYNSLFDEYMKIKK